MHLPSAPSSRASVSTSSSRASTPIDDAEKLHSAARPHTSVSIFHQGRSRISVRQRGSGYKIASEPPELQVTDYDDDYEDMPHEHGADYDEGYEDAPHEHGAGACDNIAPRPETPPAKRSYTASRASAVSAPISSHHFHLLIMFVEEEKCA